MDPNLGSAMPRRERNKQDKRERIVATTRELLANEGYDAMTIREIAARAQVAVGTVFLYASTKAELLLMVLGSEHADALANGVAAASATSSAGTGAMALLTPLLEWGFGQGDAMLAYQREVLFGEPSERYRGDSIDLEGRSEAELAHLFARHDVPNSEARARMLLNSIQFELSRALLTGTTLGELLATAQSQLELVLGGTAEPHPTTDDPIERHHHD